MQVYLNQVESLGFVDLLPAMKQKHINLARHHWSLRESEPRVLKWRKHFSLRTWIVTKSRRQCLKLLIQIRIDILCRGNLAKLSLLTSQNSKSLFLLFCDFLLNEILYNHRWNARGAKCATGEKIEKKLRWILPVETMKSNTKTNPVPRDYTGQQEAVDAWVF